MTTTTIKTNAPPTPPTMAPIEIPELIVQIIVNGKRLTLLMGSRKTVEVLAVGPLLDTLVIQCRREELRQHFLFQAGVVEDLDNRYGSVGN